MTYLPSFEIDTSAEALTAAWQQIAARDPDKYRRWKSINKSSAEEMGLSSEKFDEEYKSRGRIVFGFVNHELVPPLNGSGTGPIAAARGRAVVSLVDVLMQFYYHNKGDLPWDSI